MSSAIVPDGTEGPATRPPRSGAASPVPSEAKAKSEHFLISWLVICAGHCGCCGLELPGVLVEGTR